MTKSVIKTGVKKSGGTKAAAVQAVRQPEKLYDATDYLRNDADMAAYLDAALEDGDPAVVVHALGTIARARGMTQLARDTGMGRESLYKALSPNGNPEFATVMKVVRALGIRLHPTVAR